MIQKWKWASIWINGCFNMQNWITLFGKVSGSVASGTKGQPWFLSFVSKIRGQAKARQKNVYYVLRIQLCLWYFRAGLLGWKEVPLSFLEASSHFWVIRQACFLLFSQQSRRNCSELPLCHMPGQKRLQSVCSLIEMSLGEKPIDWPAWD